MRQAIPLDSLGDHKPLNAIGGWQTADNFT